MNIEYQSQSEIRSSLTESDLDHHFFPQIADLEQQITDQFAKERKNNRPGSRLVTIISDTFSFIGKSHYRS